MLGTAPNSICGQGAGLVVATGTTSTTVCSKNLLSIFPIGGNYFDLVVTAAQFLIFWMDPLSLCVSLCSVSLFVWVLSDRQTIPLSLCYYEFL